MKEATHNNKQTEPSTIAQLLTAIGNMSDLYTTYLMKHTIKHPGGGRLTTIDPSADAVLAKMDESIKAQQARLRAEESKALK